MTSCREVTWFGRATAGVASMAAATNAADRSLDLVISFLSLADPEPVSQISNSEITTARATRTETHSGRLARLGSNPDPDPDELAYDDHRHVDRQPSGDALQRLLVHTPYLGENECRLL